MKVSITATKDTDVLTFIDYCDIITCLNDRINKMLI